MRRIAIGLGACALLFGAIVLVAVVWRIALATTVLRYALERAGFADARFAVERVDFGAIHVTGVEAGAELRADRVEVTLDLRRLPAVPVERVRVTGAKVDLAAGAEARASKPPESPATGAPPLGLLPVLELEQAVVTAPSPVGPVVVRLDSKVSPEGGAVAMTLEGEVENAAAKATFRGAARLDDGGAVSIHMEVASLGVDDPRLRIREGTASLALTGRASGLDLEAAAGALALDLAGVAAGERKIGGVKANLPFELERGLETWRATLSDGVVRLPDEHFEVSSISGTVTAAGADLELGRVAELGAERRFEPLLLRLRAAPPRFTGQVEAGRGRATMRFEAVYEREKGEATIDVTWPRVELDPARLKPTDLSPLLAFDGTLTGAVAGSAKLRWSADRGPGGQASVTIDGVSVATGGIRADRLDGSVELASLFPPTTKGMQGLRLRELHTGVPLSDVVLLFRLESVTGGKGSRLRVERFLAGFAGGRIVVEGATLDPTAAENQLAFRLEEVDVARLFELTAIEGVSGSGRLAGSLPVTVRGGAVAIPGGKLTAGSGVLQVRSESTANLLAGGGRSAELLLEALRDFHYDELTVSIDKTFTGEATVVLHLAGKNPAVLEGRPFRINVNLTGNIDRLIHALLEVARLSDKAVRATVEAAR